MYHIIIFFSLIILLSIFAYLCCKYTGYYRLAIEINPLRLSKETLEEQIKVAQGTLSGLERRMEAKETQLSNAQTTIAQAEEAKKYLSDNASTVDQLKSTINCTQKDLDELKDTFHRKNEEFTSLQNDLSIVHGELESEKKTRDSLRDDVSKLKQDRNDLERENKRLNEDNNTLKSDQARIESELQRARKELDDKKNVLNSKNYELNKAQTNHDDIQKKIHELEDVKKRIDKELLEAQQEEKRIKTIRASWKGESEARESIEKECWADLDRAYPFIKTKSQFTQDENDWLEKFKDRMADSKIIFNERMIHAFHTGMKAADYSPIVVLAGISGTGKSLLPELYAKSLGMNFLQVAVQPRWDSPQDMLGFYNYMESRFKATELSRLLWQSDIYNNKNADRQHMNIVLLDEMNLARVEYYFSDMLSKLEVRRGINTNEAEQRHPSELVIDSGAQKARRIFIDRNTLFVGTMNEDESTQSLSDKVMDRANVLRFGKPSNLDAQPNKASFIQAYDGIAPIDLQTWQSKWCKSAQSTTQNTKLVEILNVLNEHLAAVGRPFAHRVSQSIAAYILNYPNSPNAFKHALADQLEMKVIPKLSGLEHDQHEIKKHLKELGSLMGQEVGDEKLMDAFESACNHSSGFFQWRGVQH